MAMICHRTTETSRVAHKQGGYPDANHGDCHRFEIGGQCVRITFPLVPDFGVAAHKQLPTPLIRLKLPRGKSP